MQIYAKSFVSAFIISLVALFVASCEIDKIAAIDDSTSIDVESSLEALLVDMGCIERVATRSTNDWLTNISSNWTYEDSGSGVVLLKKNNQTTYAVLAFLNSGAKVGMVFDTPTNSGQSYATFARKSIATWNTYGTFFAVANSCFFDLNNSPATLPFPLKQDNTLYTPGTGGSNDDKTKEKAVLNIYCSYAEISSIGTDPMSLTPMYYASKSYAGFYGNVGNGVNTTTGRTLVGIKDTNDDGYCNMVVLLVCAASTQTAAYNILVNEYECDEVITFDGGSSSQLLCPSYSSSKIVSVSDRTVPVAIVIKEAT